MYSIIGVLKKPDSWTTKQFRKWWLTEHAEIAKKSPRDGSRPRCKRDSTVHALQHRVGERSHH